MEKRARDVMQPFVVTLSPDEPVRDVGRRFVEHRIHGAPVVDGGGAILGVVSSTDLLRGVDDERDATYLHSEYLREILEFSPPDWGAAPAGVQERASRARVRDVMSPGALTVGPDAPVSEVAGLLRRNRVHRVWVTSRSGELLGVVSSFDLLAILEAPLAP